MTNLFGNQITSEKLCFLDLKNCDFVGKSRNFPCDLLTLIGFSLIMTQYRDVLEKMQHFSTKPQFIVQKNENEEKFFVWKI